MARHHLVADQTVRIPWDGRQRPCKVASPDKPPTACTRLWRRLSGRDGWNALPSRWCKAATGPSAWRVCRLPCVPDRRGAPGFIPIMHGEAIQFLARSMLTHTMAVGVASFSEQVRFTTPSWHWVAVCRHSPRHARVGEVPFILWASSCIVWGMALAQNSRQSLAVRGRNFP